MPRSFRSLRVAANSMPGALLSGCVIAMPDSVCGLHLIGMPGALRGGTRKNSAEEQRDETDDDNRAGNMEFQS